MKNTLLIATMFLLSGCASVMNKPDLTGSAYESRYASRRDATPVISIQIKNKAADGEHQRDGRTNFSENRLPLIVTEPAKKTVEGDISSYFATTTTQSSNGNYSLFVTILEADAFKTWKMNGTVFIPIVGMFTGNDVKIGINLKVRIEIERDGQVVKDWIYAKRIERETHANTTIEEDYQALVRIYRQQFFEEVDSNVMRFIIEKSKPS